MLDINLFDIDFSFHFQYPTLVTDAECFFFVKSKEQINTNADYFNSESNYRLVLYTYGMHVLRLCGLFLCHATSYTAS